MKNPTISAYKRELLYKTKIKSYEFIETLNLRAIRFIFQKKKITKKFTYGWL